MTTQPALFPRPAPPELARAEHYATFDKTRFPVQPKGSGACSECVWICHEANLRQESAPLPRPARHHWGTRADRIDLCDGHKRMWAEEIERLKPPTTRRTKR